MTGSAGPDAPLAAPAAVAGDVVCEVEGLTKRFGATLALEDVSLTFRAGEVLGLIGENGAGKSTLLKCLCGIHAPDHGVIRMRGEAVEPRNYREATTLGRSSPTCRSPRTSSSRTRSASRAPGSCSSTRCRARPRERSRR
jgi:ABC-type glutathione transport system ATPase component